MRYGQIPIHFFSSTKYPLFLGNKCIFLEILSCTNTVNSCLSKAPLSPTSTKFPNLYSLFGDEGQAKHIPLLSILDQRRRGCQTLTSSSQPPLFPPSWRKFQQTRNFLFISFPDIWDPMYDCKACLKSKIVKKNGESGNQSASQPVPFLYRGRKGAVPREIGIGGRKEERRLRRSPEQSSEFFRSPPPPEESVDRGGGRGKKKSILSLYSEQFAAGGKEEKSTKSSEIVLFLV